MMVKYLTSTRLNILPGHDSAFYHFKVSYFTSSKFNNLAGEGAIFYQFSIQHFAGSWFSISSVHGSTRVSIVGTMFYHLMVATFFGLFLFDKMLNKSLTLYFFQLFIGVFANLSKRKLNKRGYQKIF